MSFFVGACVRVHVQAGFMKRTTVSVAHSSLQVLLTISHAEHGGVYLDK